MRKRKKGRKFHREKDQRVALLKSLATALILNERIETTEARAKELRSFIENLITKAKKESLSSKKMIYSVLDKKVGQKLIYEIAPLFKDRKGGYTRILKLVPRQSDSSRMALIEFVK
jgi:large subunit ribosomal protein L17